MYEESIGETYSRCKYSNTNECEKALDKIQSEIKSELDSGMISQAIHYELKAKICNKKEKWG